MSKVLTAKNAILSTATVEVNTLTISGKQVTLAVFRQLKEEPLMDDEGRGLQSRVFSMHATMATNG